MFLRVAEPTDAGAMLAIYSPFIMQTGITQETEVPTTESFAERVKTTMLERPWIVCEVDGTIAGYAYAGKHRERKGYQWCVETSVYINKQFHHNGIATALYTALIEILKKQHYVNAYAVITLPNPISVSFHEKFGFTYLTTYKKIGYKLGQWHDVGWWELQLNPHDKDVIDPIRFGMFDKKFIDAALEKGRVLLKK